MTLAPVANAQVSVQPSPQTFSVSGKVSDSGGNPVDAAEVTLERNKVISEASVTGVDGRFKNGQ
jgi:hypothetical protein